MVVVEDEKTREHLIDLSRRLEPAWEDFLDTTEYLRRLRYVQGGNVIKSCCRRLTNEIDLLILEMRSAGSGKRIRAAE